MKETIVVDGKHLRLGYTTGSCAAAAAKACAIYLETGKPPRQVDLDTPAGIGLTLTVEEPSMKNGIATCAIRKDAGDDPDVTDGLLIYASVTRRMDGKICIDGGEGVGRIIEAGLFGQIGEAAINPVPKAMIEGALEEVSNCGYDCVIHVPEGKNAALKTFNKKMGIEGGISIIGTKGIVYPMSEEALLSVIYLEIDRYLLFGKDSVLVFTPGNYGEGLVRSMGYQHVIQVSNYMGDALKYAWEKGARRWYLFGHIGKFAKLSIGVMNTHSKVADTRMEAFVYYLALEGAPLSVLQSVDGAISAEKAANQLWDEGYASLFSTMASGIAKRVKTYLKTEDMEIAVGIYSMEKGVLC